MLLNTGPVRTNDIIKHWEGTIDNITIILKDLRMGGVIMQYTDDLSDLSNPFNTYTAIGLEMYDALMEAYYR